MSDRNTIKQLSMKSAIDHYKKENGLKDEDVFIIQGQDSRAEDAVDMLYDAMHSGKKLFVIEDIDKLV